MAVVVNNWDNKQALVLKAAVAVAVGELLYIDSNGKFALVDIDASNARYAMFVAVTKAAAGEDVTGTTCADISGLAPGGSTPAAGDLIYASDTAGGITKAIASTATDSVIPVGVLVSATRCFFHIAAPAPLTLQASGNSTVAY